MADDQDEMTEVPPQRTVTMYGPPIPDEMKRLFDQWGNLTGVAVLAGAFFCEFEGGFQLKFEPVAACAVGQPWPRAE